MLPRFNKIKHLTQGFVIYFESIKSLLSKNQTVVVSQNSRIIIKTHLVYFYRFTSEQRQFYCTNSVTLYPNKKYSKSALLS